MRRALTVMLVVVACGRAQTAPPVSDPPPLTTVARATTTTAVTPNPVSVIVLSEQGIPLSGATVRVGDLTVTTDAHGMASFPPSGAVHHVAASGYEGQWLLLDSPETTVVLEALVVAGRVVGLGGRALEGARVNLAGWTTQTDSDGEFSFVAPPNGILTVERAAYSQVALQPGPWVDVEMKPLAVRGLHMTGTLPGEERWAEILEILEKTEINAVVIDLKDESGKVFYDSDVVIAREAGALKVSYSIAEVAADLDARGGYLVGRIVAFADPVMASARRDLAIQNFGTTFLDPTDEVARLYILDLAAEACDRGVREIQFDYVRFPAGYGSSAGFDGPADAAGRVEAIASFLQEASALLHPKGCAVAADIFGFITSSSTEGGIGQHLETLATAVDVLSPMLYPSLYDDGWFGFSVPSDHPGPVVAAALDDGLARVGGSVIIRPWLQDFFYNAAQVRQEIESAEARNLGWMLWNVRSSFRIGALEGS